MGRHMPNLLKRLFLVGVSALASAAVLVVGRAVGMSETLLGAAVLSAIAVGVAQQTIP